MVRTLLETDREEASAVCMRAFLTAVAPSLSSTGVETFGTIAAADGFAQRSGPDSLQVVYDDAGVIKGVAELKERRHVAMLFVDPACQRQGVGEALLAAVMAQARSEVVTVNASLSSVAFYQRHGFACSAEVGESAGLIYQPMTRSVSHAAEATFAAR
ncbi:GNAT superfamily N-acetyltransferase [Stenotrophomonas sp. 2619]|uniref:GNAT family N-acetyltransferase n=1 Tax=Stenotrophomonas sp. 2619 TaxID=3156316 RepID=UPI0033996ED5